MDYFIALLMAVVVVAGGVAQANAPQSKSEFCYQASHDPEYFLKLAFESDNRLAFANKGGLLDGGVCWWHSLFQRSALYLTVYKPGEAKPTRQQAKNIIYNLSHLLGVVEIPGYANMRTFSLDWSGEIQHSLELWQARDGFINQKWVGNITRTTHLPADQLRQNMQYLWREVEDQKHVTWTMLKLPGITAHAWLVLHLVADGLDYRLQVIDSNAPGKILTPHYHDGDTSLHTRNGETVPYVSRTQDFGRFVAAKNTYCRQ